MRKIIYKFKQAEIEELYKIYSNSSIKVNDICKIYNCDNTTLYANFKRVGINRKVRSNKKFSVAQELDI